MKKQLIIWTLMFSVLLAVAMAYDMCGEQKEINQNCTMVTPTLTGCVDYNYTIYNITDGSVAQDGPLTNMVGDIYEFNITIGAGDYIISLCDGATREIKVESNEDNNMIIAAIVLIPALLGIVLLLGSFFLGDEHAVLRLFMFLLSPILFIVSLHYGVIALVKFYDFPELQDAIGGTIYWFMLIFGLIIAYFLLYLLAKMTHYMAGKKEEKLNY